MASIRGIILDQFGTISTVYDLLMQHVVDVVKERPELSYDAVIPLAENRLVNDIGWLCLGDDEEAEVDQSSVGSV